MNRRAKGWGAAALIMLTSAAVILGARQRSARLQIQLAAARQGQAQREAAERPQQPNNDSDLELARLRASEIEWQQLHGEMERLESAETPSRRPEVPETDSTKVVGLMKAASEWRNVGRSTPARNLETALWAAAGGDVEALAGLVTFHDNTRAKAEAALARMPAEVRRKYDSPEKWAAFFTVQDIPTTGNMRIMSEGHANEGEMRLGVLFFNDQASTEEKERYGGIRELAFRPDDGGWKLVVPASAVEAYAATVKTDGK